MIYLQILMYILANCTVYLFADSKLNKNTFSNIKFKIKKPLTGFLSKFKANHITAL